MNFRCDAYMIERGDLSGRCLGIDLARLLAMFMVCWGHIIYLGEYVTNTQGGNFLVSQMINVLTVGCVDLFALISGFVGLYSRCRFSSWVKLWGLVFFYNFIIRLIFKDASIRGYLPVYGNVYWYVTAYSGLFMIMPVINEGVKGLSRAFAIRVGIGIFLISSLTMFTNRDIMFLRQGYSFIWLTLLYILGAISRRFIIFYTKQILIITISIISIFVFGLSILCPQIPIVSYTSPFILLCMICLMELCTKMTTAKLIFSGGGAFSVNIFAVYLIHVHPIIFYGPLKKLCIASRVVLSEKGPGMIFFGTLGLAVIILCLCIFMDMVRTRLWVRMRCVVA